MTITNKNQKKQSFALIYCAFIAGVCSIIYELLIATTVSYFLGDSVKFFSITIGIYMAAMGVGSYLSKYIDNNLLEKFITIELWLGLIGGLSIPLLYFAYAYTNSFIAIYIILTAIIGIFIGLEIPFLTRLMQNYNSLKFNIANILSFDYAGALIATLCFPFILLPFLGVYQSSLVFGLINMSIGFAVTLTFKSKITDNFKFFIIKTIIFTFIIIAMIIFSSSALKHWNKQLYRDRVIYSEQSKYQKIVLTKFKDDVRLFLDGNLQFSSKDEYRYHESIVHTPLSIHNFAVKRVLVLGAGDGMAVRELLKYPNIKEIILVDLDKKIVNLSKNNPHVNKLNQNSLEDKKVKIIIGDAYSYLLKNDKAFDFIINDLPDPNNNELARLYSKEFYTHVGLRRNQIGEDVEVTRIVASLIKENEIATSYDLLGNKLAESKEVAKIIADALMANKVITSCDLTGNGLEDADIAKNKEGAEIFASMIAKCCIEERNLELKIGEYAFNTNDVSTIHGMKDEDIKAKIFEKIEAQMSNETKPSEVHQLGSVDKYKNKQDVVQYYKN